MKATILVATLCLLLATACANHAAFRAIPAGPAAMQTTPSAGPVVGNQTVLAEISRLASLTAKGNVTEADFGALTRMLAADDHASNELAETLIMARHGEMEHVGHGLGFLADYVQTGRQTLCPGHALVHYYVYMKYNESDAAQDQLKEAEDSLENWIPVARAFDAKYPSGQDFEATVARIRADLAAIQAGNATASDQEIRFLDTAGSICVPAAG